MQVQFTSLVTWSAQAESQKTRLRLSTLVLRSPVPWYYSPMLSIQITLPGHRARQTWSRATRSQSAEEPFLLMFRSGVTFPPGPGSV